MSYYRESVAGYLGTDVRYKIFIPAAASAHIVLLLGIPSTSLLSLSWKSGNHTFSLQILMSHPLSPQMRIRHGINVEALNTVFNTVPCSIQQDSDTTRPMVSWGTGESIKVQERWCHISAYPTDLGTLTYSLNHGHCMRDTGKQLSLM